MLFTSELVEARRARLISITETLLDKGLLPLNSSFGTSTKRTNCHEQSKQKVFAHWNVWICQSLGKAAEAA